MDAAGQHINSGGPGGGGTVASKGTKKDKGKRSAVESKPARKVRGRRGKLASMLLLPNEIFLEIACYVGPESLLQMSRATRGLRDVLMSKSSKIIWRTSWSCSGIPEPPQYSCEPFYAALIFDKFCLNCDAKKADKSDLACHVRFCFDCFAMKVTTIEDAKSGADESDVDEVVKVLPYFGQSTPYKEPHTLDFWHATRKFLVIEFHSVLTEYAEANENSEASETFLAERLSITNDRVEFKRQILEWMNVSARQRRQSTTKVVTERRTMIKEKLYELGYSDQDIRLTYWRGHGRDVNSRKWLRLVGQPRPLTDRIWNTLRPQLEEILKAWREEKEETIGRNKKLRTTELAKLYEEFQKSFPGSNILPCGILAQIPDILEEISRDDYKHPLVSSIWGGGAPDPWGRINSQLPNIVNWFHHMVVNDYLQAVAGTNTSRESQENWGARFKAKSEADDESYLGEPDEYRLCDARKALSFVDTPQGIVSFEMLEAVGWWTALLPAPRSVLHLASMVLRQLGISKDISMSHMMSLGAIFICARCGGEEQMSWISLLDHFKTQQVAHEDQNGGNECREFFDYLNTFLTEISIPDSGVHAFDRHSYLDPSPVVKLLGPNNEITDNANKSRVGNSDINVNPPQSCTLCKDLNVETSFSTENDIQTHFHSRHRGYVVFDA